jgi:hypothetical protein
MSSSQELSSQEQELSTEEKLEKIKNEMKLRNQAQREAKQAQDQARLVQDQARLARVQAEENAEIKAKKDQEIKQALTVTAVDLYNKAMNKIFPSVDTQKKLFGPTNLFNPMNLPISLEVAKKNLLETTKVGFTDQQWSDVQKRPQKFKKYIQFLEDNGFFDSEGNRALSGSAKSGIIGNVEKFINSMETGTIGNYDVNVTLRDIVTRISSSVKSQPDYCESLKLFIAILTAVKFIINKGIPQPKFEFSTPSGFFKMFSKSTSTLQKNFGACFEKIPDGDPVDTNYFNFDTKAFEAAAAAAAGGSKSMRKNRRHRNRRNKTHRGRGRSHKRASKSYKRA